jgi:IS30 family transposase
MAPHLTLEEREWIAQGRAAGKSGRAIAEELDRSQGTISRELRRNRSRSGYFPSGAQRRADQRRREQPLVRKMDRPEVGRFVREKLRQYWSPAPLPRLPNAPRSLHQYPSPRCN